jgi:hypothetical protein
LRFWVGPFLNIIENTINAEIAEPQGSNEYKMKYFYFDNDEPLRLWTSPNRQEGRTIAL